MHDVGYRKYEGMWGQEKQSKSPQWFRANHKITLEGVKHADPYELGMRIKQMFHELENTIKKYKDIINNHNSALKIKVIYNNGEQTFNIQNDVA